jgi:competence protein ComEC
MPVGEPSPRKPKWSHSFIASALVLLTGPALTHAIPTYLIRDSAAPCLRLRPEPRTDATPLDCIPPGTQVTVLDSSPYWRLIHLPDGRKGWAAKKFLEPEPTPAPEDVPIPIPSDAFLEVHFVDVGQGDAIWIATHDDDVQGNGVFEGRNIIIDGGPNSADHSNALFAYLQEQAHHDANVDTLIVTHPHDDHYRGAETILRHFEVAQYYDPGFERDGAAYAAFLEAAEAETIDGQPSDVMRGRDNFAPLDWGNELTGEFLYSYPGIPASLGSGGTLINNASIVLRLEYGDHVFLFMGDAEGKDRHDSPQTSRYVEKILIDTVPADRLRATVLKIGHHGSETSSTRDFIDAVSPEIVVAQSGRRVFSGTFIPDTSTLRRYCCADPATRIYRTDQDDEADGLTAANDSDADHVVIRTNGTELEVEAFEGGQPFSVGACQPACQ